MEFKRRNERKTKTIKKYIETDWHSRIVSPFQFRIQVLNAFNVDVLFSGADGKGLVMFESRSSHV